MMLSIFFLSLVFFLNACATRIRLLIVDRDPISGPFLEFCWVIDPYEAEKEIPKKI
jgi:hypothetical protein